MTRWITDRTDDDVAQVKALALKAKAGTWTEKEQAEWAAGMKGALSSRLDGWWLSFRYQVEFLQPD